jgi:flavin-dependent dehydrogenase
MLLARLGHRVLLVDRATFPSDTISTHLVHPPGVASLERWGLLDPVIATGSPPIHTYAFDLGPTISGAPGTDESPVAYAPRRTVLDKMLVDAASEAGAEVRERFTVESLVVEDGRVVGVRGRGKGGKSVTERAQVVIGADGRYSLVADAVGAEEYNEKPQLQVSYYTYWSGLPMSGRFETALRPGLGYAAWPTSDDLTLVIAGRSIDEFDTLRKDIEGTYLETLEIAPAFADRVRGAKREERYVGTAVRGYLRKPFGPGWALVGDAGYKNAERILAAAA